MMDVAQTGKVLAAARRDGRKLAEYPGEKPSDLKEAFAIQDAMVREMGVPVVGWKVGLTSERAQKLCGVDAPLAGPLFEGHVFDSGAEISMVEGDLGIVEAEIGFHLRSDLPPRDLPYERSEVLEAVGTVHPVFEWVNKRLPGDIRETAEWLVADGVINRGLVCGAGVSFDRNMELSAETVQVSKNGEMFTEGVGANALGDPLSVLVWLANDLNARGKGLRDGDWVATGLICDVAIAEPGAEFTAKFSNIGQVRLSVAP